MSQFLPIPVAWLAGGITAFVVVEFGGSEIVVGASAVVVGLAAAFAWARSDRLPNGTGP